MKKIGEARNTLMDIKLTQVNFVSVGVVITNYEKKVKKMMVNNMSK